MSTADPRPAVAIVPEGWTPKAGSGSSPARPARPHRRPGLPAGRAPQGPRRGPLRRRVRDGGHGLRRVALQHGRSRPHHDARHQRRRGRGRRRAGHDPPQRPADAAAAAVPDRAQGGRGQHPAGDAGRQHSLERRAGRGRPGRDAGTGRPRRLADRGRLRVLDAADVRGGQGAPAHARQPRRSAGRGSGRRRRGCSRRRAAFDRPHLPHAAPQSQCDRAARGDARLGGRGPHRPRRQPGGEAARVDVGRRSSESTRTRSISPRPTSAAGSAARRCGHTICSELPRPSSPGAPCESPSRARASTGWSAVGRTPSNASRSAPTTTVASPRSSTPASPR